MREIIWCLVFTFSITSWSQNGKAENEYEEKKLCSLLEKMDNKDQEKRKIMPQDPFFKTMRSYRTDTLKLSAKEYSKLPMQKMLEYGKKIRKIVGKFPNEKQKVEIDSLMRLQIILDNKNTELLIDIIEKRGYPNKNNCNCEKFPSLVFRHSQSQYWEKIKVIIEKEHKEKRLNDFDYKLFINHINGRKTNIIN